MKIEETPPNLRLRKLLQSFAPSVFGAGPIKHALLLMMLGGVHKVTKEVLGHVFLSREEC